jgi:hypothetical protein
MNKKLDDHQWIYYLETPRQQSEQPVKLNAILKSRIETFMSTRKIKRLLTEE